MRTSVLASGSEGNVTYVETANHKILLDIGMTVKYIKENSKQLHVDDNKVAVIGFSAGGHLAGNICVYTGRGR